MRPKTTSFSAERPWLSNGHIKLNDFNSFCSYHGSVGLDPVVEDWELADLESGPMNCRRNNFEAWDGLVVVVVV